MAARAVINGHSPRRFRTVKKTINTVNKKSKPSQTKDPSTASTTASLDQESPSTLASNNSNTSFNDQKNVMANSSHADSDTASVAKLKGPGTAPSDSPFGPGVNLCHQGPNPIGG